MRSAFHVCHETQAPHTRVNPCYCESKDVCPLKGEGGWEVHPRRGGLELAVVLVQHLPDLVREVQALDLTTGEGGSDYPFQRQVWSIRFPWSTRYDPMS